MEHVADEPVCAYDVHKSVVMVSMGACCPIFGACVARIEPVGVMLVSMHLGVHGLTHELSCPVSSKHC